MIQAPQQHRFILFLLMSLLLWATMITAAATSVTRTTRTTGAFAIHLQQRAQRSGTRSTSTRYHRVLSSLSTSSSSTISSILRTTALWSSALYNFGPVSLRDDVLFTAQRPGNDSNNNNNNDNQSIGLLDLDAAQAQIQYWQDIHDITHVLSLLDKDEYENYPEPGLVSLYEQSNLICFQQPMQSPMACNNIMQFLDEVVGTTSSSSSNSKRPKIVVHCTGGIGRAGRVAAAWLVHRYQLSPDAATAETLAVAKTMGIHRKGHAGMLEGWMRMQ